MDDDILPLPNSMVERTGQGGRPLTTTVTQK
jgi:hypothetical protein